MAARRCRAEAPPCSHTRRQRRTLSAHTPTALAISAFETPSSNNSTARTRRASANLGCLFLHYAFDTWMVREFPAVWFERYADDAVLHCV
ncbi:hypothetical protein ACFVY1_47110, partial [Streptomyces sp. NPDC058293]